MSRSIFCDLTVTHSQQPVVQKIRDVAISVSSPLKPPRKLWEPIVRRRSSKSIFLTRSSITEDYYNIPAFLGRYRTPSSPELRGAQHNPLYRNRFVPRASSLNSLRHPLPDKERTLYIGVSNFRLLLPLSSDLSPTQVVTYRPALREERRTPSMTPYAITGPGHFHIVPAAMSSTTSAGAQSTPELSSAGFIRRSSSDVSIAGSMTSDSDITVRFTHTSSP